MQKSAKNLERFTLGTLTKPLRIKRYKLNRRMFTVEIDKSYFFFKKYNIGAYYKGAWIFVAFKVENNEFFLQIFCIQRKDTLHDLI